MNNKKTMAAGDKAKKDIEMAERRKLVASLLTRKIDQTDIAATIKKQRPDWDVSQPTISRDIKWLKAQWLEDSKQSVEDWKAGELADLDDMERDCALQFSSKKSPEWIRVRLSLKERRAKLLGLDAPVKTDNKLEIFDPYSEAIKQRRAERGLEPGP